MLLHILTATHLRKVVMAFISLHSLSFTLVSVEYDYQRITETVMSMYICISRPISSFLLTKTKNKPNHKQPMSAYENMTCMYISVQCGEISVFDRGISLST